MSVSCWFPWTCSRSHALCGQRRSLVSRRKKAGLFLEHLEGRALLSAYAAANVTALIADISAANTAGGSNTITLTAPTTSPYVLTAVNNTTNGANGLPVIAAKDSLKIVGGGDTIERSTASGTPSFRLLDVAAGASLTMGKLTLQDGLALAQKVIVSNTLTWLPGDGGAIYNQGVLTLTGVTVQNNIAQGVGPPNSVGVPGCGGGIYSSGSLTLEGSSTVQNNQALGGSGGHLESFGGYGAPGGNGFGGGLDVAGGTATLTNVTLSANTAQGGQGGTYSELPKLGGNGGNGFGGALEVSGGTVSLTGATLSSNTAQGGQGGDGGNGGNGFGGALQVSGGAVSVTRSALSSNTAQGGNGAVDVAADPGYTGNGGNGFGGGLEVGGGTVTLTSVTVTTNDAHGGSPGIGGWFPYPMGEGGGVYIASGATVYIDAFTLANVISNTASTSNPNIFGTYIKT
jgi:hypothetical protein